MVGVEVERTRSRVTRFLRRGAATIEPASQSGAVLLTGADGAMVVDGRIILAMAREGLLLRKEETIRLGAARAAMRREGGEDVFLDQHRDLARVDIDTGSGFAPASVNLSESPLGQLARHRTKSGAAFLEAAEFDAGERLRSDYARGMIMPRLGANWEASVAPGRRGGSAADLTDAALAARQRVDMALTAVGPELSGVLVDVCCFLKGLETVERERGWPVRSAKIVLKTALAALDRHYQPPARPRRACALHWGSHDYRPAIR